MAALWYIATRRVRPAYKLGHWCGRNEMEWNFFSALPNDEAELNRRCVWEYARECLPLVQRIRKLRMIVGNLMGIGDEGECARKTFRLVWARDGFTRIDDVGVLAKSGSKTYRELSAVAQRRNQSLQDFITRWTDLIDQISDITPRFDWRFFCSTAFPDKNWKVAAKMSVDDGQAGVLFRRTAWPSTGTFEVRVPHGKKRTRTKQVRRMPKLYRLEVEVGKPLVWGNPTEAGIIDLKIFEQDIIEIAQAQRESVGGRAHCFVVPDEYFDLHDPADLAAAFRSQCYLLDRRRPIANDVFWGQFGRVSCEAYLRSLGMMRLFHQCDRAERDEFLAALQKRKRPQSVAPKLWAKIQHFVGRADHSEARRAAKEILQKIFRVPPATKPISYGAYR